MSESRLDYYLTLIAKLDETSLSNAVKEIEAAASKKYVATISVQADLSAFNDAINARLRELGRPGLQVPSQTASPSSSSAAGSFDADMATRVLNNAKQQEAGRRESAGANRAAGAAERGDDEEESKLRFGYTLSGANRAQLERVARATEQLFASDAEEAIKLSMKFSAKGKYAAGEIGSKQTGDSVLSAIMAQSDAAQQSGLAGTLRIAGSGSDLESIREFMAKIAAISNEITAAQPEVARTKGVPNLFKGGYNAETRRQGREDPEIDKVLDDRLRRQADASIRYQVGGMTADEANAKVASDRDARLARWRGENASASDEHPYDARVRRYANEARSYDRNLSEADALAQGHARVAREAVTFADRMRRANETLTPFQEMMRMIGSGHIRGGVAQGVTTMLGGGTAAELTGAMAGGIASSIALPIAWAIGNQIMNIIPEIQTRQRESAVLGAMSKGDYRTGERAAIGTWSGVAGGKAIDYWYAGAKQMQDYGYSDAEIRTRMHTASQLQFGDAAARGNVADIMARLKREPGARTELYDASKYVRDVMHETWDSRFHIDRVDSQYRDEALRNYIKSGQIGYRDIERAAAEAGSRAGNRVQAELDTDSSRARSWWARRMDQVTHFYEPENLKKSLNPFGGGGAVADLVKDWFFGNEGRANAGPNKPISADLHPDLQMSQYQWTSFTGLAEQMQQMWSGAPVDAMAGAATDIKDAAANLNKAVAPLTALADFFGLGASAQPAATAPAN